MKLKVCGMKFKNNISKISNLNPDFMGFIFWPKSKRFFNKKTINISGEIKKVGVFVNQSFELILEKINTYKLDFIQLHGDETPQFCKRFESYCKVIKVFNIGKDFNFEKLSPFEKVCEYFLFDTKADSHGGSGVKFNWKILENYPSKKSFFLSGGIEITNLKEIEKIVDYKIPLQGIDINSKFEIKPGLKDFRKIEELINKMKK